MVNKNLCLKIYLWNFRHSIIVSLSGDQPKCMSVIRGKYLRSRAISRHREDFVTFFSLTFLNSENFCQKDFRQG